MSDGNPHGTLYTIEWLNKLASPPSGPAFVLAESLRSNDSRQQNLSKSRSRLVVATVGVPVTLLRRADSSTINAGKGPQKETGKRPQRPCPDVCRTSSCSKRWRRKPDYYNGITDAKIKQAQRMKSC